MTMNAAMREGRPLGGVGIGAIVAFVITAGNYIIWNFVTIAPGTTGAAMSTALHKSIWAEYVLIAMPFFVWGYFGWVCFQQMLRRLGT